MTTSVRVLGDDDCSQIHERSLKLLQDTGVRVLSERARGILAAAGAEVERGGERTRIPRAMVEDALKRAPREFVLGTRRTGRSLPMNAGSCWLCADGGALSVFDWKSREKRAGTLEDWLAATALIEALDEIDIYWNMIEGGFRDTRAGYVEYWTHLLRNCSKHIQDSVASSDRARLLLEILDVAYGGKEQVRSLHPFSYILCPMSPLVIDSTFTDAYLDTVEWDLPVAIMPMPLLGATAPASLIATLLTANADFLATLCLVQAAAPARAVIYAALPSAVEPHTWKYTGGGPENALLNAAAAEMGRYYGLPVEIGAGGSDHVAPGTQASYERALNSVLCGLEWPDILIGPGLLGGSTILSLEQMVIDVEIFRRCRHMRTGIASAPQHLLENVLVAQGPGGSFVGERTTLAALREAAFYMGKLGFHGSYEKWRATGMPALEDEAHEKVEEILGKHQPAPLEAEVERELRALAVRAQDSEA